MLFLVGEQRRDTIPKTLMSEELPYHEQIQVVELVVYETGEMATFEEDFTGLVRQAKAKKVKEQWVVVFSPQGCYCRRRGTGASVQVVGEETGHGLEELGAPKERVLIGSMFFAIMPECVWSAHARSYNLIFSKHFLLEDYDMV